MCLLSFCTDKISYFMYFSCNWEKIAFPVLIKVRNLFPLLSLQTVIFRWPVLFHFLSDRYNFHRHINVCRFFPTECALSYEFNQYLHQITFAAKFSVTWFHRTPSGATSNIYLREDGQMNIRRLAVVTGFAKGFTKVEDLRGCFMWIVVCNGGE